MQLVLIEKWVFGPGPANITPCTLLPDGGQEKPRSLVESTLQLLHSNFHVLPCIIGAGVDHNEIRLAK